MRCGNGLLTKRIILSTLFKISIVGLCVFDLTDKKSDIYPSLKIIENNTVVRMSWKKNHVDLSNEHRIGMEQMRGKGNKLLARKIWGILFDRHTCAACDRIDPKKR